MAENEWEDVTSSNDTSNDWEDVPDPKQKKNSDFVPNAIAGGAGVLGAAGIGYGAKKMVFDPLKERFETKDYLKSIGKQFGLDPKQPVENIPTNLKEMEKNIPKEARIQTTELQSRLNNINNVQIAQKADSLANYIKPNWMATHQKVMDNYKTYVDRIDNMAMESGVELSNRAYAEEVLDKVINKAKESGLSDSDLKVYEDTKKALIGKSGILDVEGKPIEVNLKASDAKSIMSNLKKLDPYGRVSAYLDDSYTEFMAKHTPAEVSKLYQEANAGYKPYAEARYRLEKTSPSGAGEFDTRKLTALLEEYAKKNKGGDTVKLIQFLDKGNNIVPPIQGIGARFGELDNLRLERNDVMQSLKSIPEQTARQVGDISAVSTNVDANKARLLAATGKLNILNPLKWPGKILGAMGGIAKAVPGGAIENRLQTEVLGYDPVEGLDAILKASFGSEKEKAMGRIKRRGEELAWQEQNQI